MPTKKPTKSRVSKTSTKKSGFQFRWWMGLILVVIVAGIGIAVIRLSRASSITSIRLYNGSGCTRVTLNHNTAKATIPSNVCLLSLTNVPGGSVSLNTSRDILYPPYNAGRPGTYCFWGRYSAPAGTEFKISTTYSGDGAGSASNPKTFYGSDSGVTGYGTNFSVNGDNIKLGCEYNPASNLRSLDIRVLKPKNVASIGQILLFVDQITFE